jgi:hypothetical protein
MIDFYIRSSCNSKDHVPQKHNHYFYSTSWMYVSVNREYVQAPKMTAGGSRETTIGSLSTKRDTEDMAQSD